ncbi:MAG: hypothetical protein KGL90_12365 [Burkholderiales bacterium]|nr:hypothetical protein [Burkholderiales bacterium]
MHSQPHKAQQGVVLIVVLIMLVIIGLTSAAVMRNALSADLASANVRNETLATEAAQAALAYCEQQVITAGSTMPIKAVSANQHWADLTHWLPGAADGTVSPPNWKTASATGNSGSAKASTGTAPAPQCMAEKITLTGAGDAILVTARGFTPDFQESAKGQTITGSAVWLQSTLQVK